MRPSEGHQAYARNEVDKSSWHKIFRIISADISQIAVKLQMQMNTQNMSARVVMDKM
jgi:hypothetical protein